VCGFLARQVKRATLEGFEGQSNNWVFSANNDFSTISTDGIMIAQLLSE
jgi:hypothetical protein